MDYVDFGATGLRVSAAGLGCGGNSRLGLGVGKSEDEAAALVREAFDLGVNFFDTAGAYGTEDVVGRALRDLPRDQFVVSTKSLIQKPNGALLSGKEVIANLEDSMRRLGLDHIDVFHAHAVLPAQYYHVMREIAPLLWRAKEEGKIGHLGITETPPRDPEQAMLSRALFDDCWGVMMLAFHMMNQGARDMVLPRAIQKRVGTLIMFAVRNIFSQPGELQNEMRKLAEQKQLPQALADDPAPLDFLIHESGASSLTDAAYRYARHEPGVHVVLFGTSNPAHLRANIASILRPPLPQADRERLRVLFEHIRGAGLVFPDKDRMPNYTPPP